MQHRLVPDDPGSPGWHIFARAFDDIRLPGEPLEARWIAFLDAVKEWLEPGERLPLAYPEAKADLLGGLLRFRLADGTEFPAPPASR